MLKNYITLALRSFRKDRTYALINLFGLAVALAAVLLIVAYIRYELSFDRHFGHSDKIYQLLIENRSVEPAVRNMGVPEPLGRTLRDEFPEVEATTPLTKGNPQFKLHDELVAINTIRVGSDFFKLFDLPFVYGHAGSALADGHNLVLASDVAQKFFPNENPIGKTIPNIGYDGDTTLYVVSAVVENMPSNTHFSAEAILLATSYNEALNFSNYAATPQYILLKEGTDIAQLQKKMVHFGKKYNIGKNTELWFLPLTDIRLRSGKIDDQQNQVSDIRFVYIFAFIALLILVIACINYINLTTARALQRVTEVGMRKVLGARRGQLALQFIGESFLMFCFSIPFACVLAYIAWPVFSSFLHIRGSISFLFNLQNVLAIATVALLSSTLSGLYPALFLSRLLPVSIFKNRALGLKVNFSLRKTLIVLQFSISVLLIIVTTVMRQQLHMMNNRPLGFDKDFLLTLPYTGWRNEDRAMAFKQRLLQEPTISDVSIGNLTLGERYGPTSSMPHPSDSTQRIVFSFVEADFDFMKTMGIQLAAGRRFSADHPGDMLDFDALSRQAANTKDETEANQLREIVLRRPLIITESLVKALNIKHPIDTVLKFAGWSGTVIGVAKDFQATTLKEESPLYVFRPNFKTSGNGFVRIQNHHIAQTIQAIESQWKQFFPDKIFSYTFADERIQQLYESEGRLVSLFGSFSLLAICISAMGLFSLVALMVRQRTKEIGIRKVLGASVSSIVNLLSKDFVKLVLIAVVIASPIAWWAMNKWLEDYAYRIEIQWWMFALAGLAAIVVAILTVASQAIKSAVANPVESLRDE